MVDESREIIQGIWYIATMQNASSPSPAKLVLGLGSGIECDKDGRPIGKDGACLDDLPEIRSLGLIENMSFIFEDPVNPWDSLSAHLLTRKDSSTYAGAGKLNIEKRTYSKNRFITPTVRDKLLSAEKEKACHVDGSLFVVRYRDANDRDTNPFHQMGVIAKDEEDNRLFLQRFRTLFNEEVMPLEEKIGDPAIKLHSGIIVMPQIIKKYQQGYDSFDLFQ